MIQSIDLGLALGQGTLDLKFGQKCCKSDVKWLLTGEWFSTSQSLGAEPLTTGGLSSKAEPDNFWLWNTSGCIELYKFYKKSASETFNFP